MSTRHHWFRALADRPRVLRLTGIVPSVDVFAMVGSPAFPVDVRVIVEAGAIIYGPATSSGADVASGQGILFSASFAEGSVFKLTVQGLAYIVGGGGNGRSSSATGSVGGTAVRTYQNLDVYNYGFIFAGGNGGRAGANTAWLMGTLFGGGGGGGQGYEGGGGGFSEGNNGRSGSWTGPGNGGKGESVGGGVFQAEDGKPGGNWGMEAGGATTLPWAIRTHAGSEVTLYYGNNPTQLKGRVGA